MSSLELADRHGRVGRLVSVAESLRATAGENLVVVVESLLKSSIRTADIRWNCIQEGINKKAIITLIEARNQEVLEWKEALKFLGTIVGALRTEGELFTAFYNDDSCVIN